MLIRLFKWGRHLTHLPPFVDSPMKTLKSKLPKGLPVAIRYFSDSKTSLELVAKSKWPSGPECPRCRSKRLSFLATRMIWKCLECKKQLSVKVGTILEDSAVPLEKWLTTIWLLSNSRTGISSDQLAHVLGVKQRTACLMLHRIRYAMHKQPETMYSGVQEDEDPPNMPEHSG